METITAYSGRIDNNANHPLSRVQSPTIHRLALALIYYEEEVALLRAELEYMRLRRTLLNLFGTHGSPSPSVDPEGGVDRDLEPDEPCDPRP